jgi:cardiolipin synthase
MSNTNYKSEILTIPNLLSLVRIALIPLVINIYVQGHYVAAGIILLASALTDSLDGFIARRFNQITSLGKVLDPIADKLTQFAVAICLCFTYTALIPLAIVLTIKELAMAALGFLLLRRGQEPFSARWWGKIASFVFYVAAIVIMIFGTQMSPTIVWIISLVAILLLGYSLWRYIGIYRQLLSPKNAGFVRIQ